MLKLLLLFAGVRSLMALAIAWLLPLHDSRPLSATFGDLALYNGSADRSLPLWSVPNPLYAVLVRWLGYDHGHLQDWLFVGLSLGLNLAFSAVFVGLACQVLRPRQALLYAAVLGGHPYLALYSLKLDTSLFALLPVGLLSAAALTPLSSTWALLATSLSSFLRNGLLPMGWLQMLWSRSHWRSLAGAAGIGVLTGSTALQLGYGASYVGQNYGCYSLARVSEWVGAQGWPGWAATALGLVITPVIHLLLDLGAREAVANHCVLLPVSIAQQPWLHLGATLIFVVLHGWLLLRLVAFVRHHAPSHPSTLQLLFSLAMLLPTLYGAAHMRYLIPIIPVLLLCAFELRVVRGFADNYKPNMLA
jgi:hypothetical protein